MEELELKPISSMFEEPEEAVTEVTNSIFSDFDAPEEGEEKVENKEVEKDIETEVEEVKENNEDEETDLTSVKTLYNYWKEFLSFSSQTLSSTVSIKVIIISYPSFNSLFIQFLVCCHNFLICVDLI